MSGCSPKAEETVAPSEPPKSEGAVATADGTFASVQPVLAKCTGCHGERGKEGIDLRSHDSILKGGEEGAIVKPGDPANSVLVQALRGANGKRQMPPSGPLAEDQIAKVEAWIKAGAKA